VKVKEVKAGMPSFRDRNTSATVELDKYHGKRFSWVLPFGLLHRPHEQEGVNESSGALQGYEARTVVTPTRNEDEQSSAREDIEISKPCEAAAPNGRDDQEGARTIPQLNLAPVISNPNNDQLATTETEQEDASTKMPSPEEAKNVETKTMRAGVFATFLSSSHDNKKVSHSSTDNNHTKNDGIKVTRKYTKLWRIKPSWTRKHRSSKALAEGCKENEATKDDVECPSDSSIHPSDIPSPPGDVATTSFLVIRPTTQNNMSPDRVFNVDDDDQDDEEQAEAVERDRESFHLINLERTQRGLQPLRSSDYLSSLANSHATVMAEHGMLGHSVENLVDLQLQLRSMDVGENIQSGSSIKDMHVNAMKEGTSNRMNILRASYLEYGCGSAVSEDDGKLYHVQLFRGKPPVVETNKRVDSATVREEENSQCDYIHCCAWYLNGGA
jgi:uncharacterized protein YkwD